MGAVYRRGEAFPFWPAWLHQWRRTPQRQSCSRRCPSMRGGLGTRLVALLALLAACAGAPVTWDVEAGAVDALPSTFRWGAVETPPSVVVGAEAKRVVDRALRERGFTETADARLLVLARFGPASGGPSEWRYTPPPGALAGVVGIGPTTIPSTLFWGEWRAQVNGGERVELTLVDRVTNRALCRGQTVFELRGYADSERIAAVREATEDGRLSPAAMTAGVMERGGYERLRALVDRDRLRGAAVLRTCGT